MTYDEAVQRLQNFLISKIEYKKSDYLFKNILEAVNISIFINRHKDRHSLFNNFMTDEYVFLADKLTKEGFDYIYKIFVHQFIRDGFVLKKKTYNALFVIFDIILKEREQFFETNELMKNNKNSEEIYFPRHAVVHTDDSVDFKCQDVYYYINMIKLYNNLVNLLNKEMNDRYNLTNNTFHNFKQSALYENYKNHLVDNQREYVNKILDYARKNPNINVSYLTR